ncbi:hypothetical protein LINPERHAP2_LOCUS23149 [Linum perenne]
MSRQRLSSPTPRLLFLQSRKCRRMILNLEI